MKTPHIQCPYCHSPYRQIKWGRTTAGSQKYRCHDCQRIYTPTPLSNGYPADIRQQAVQLHLKGERYRRIGKLLGVHHQSVANWVNRYHSQHRSLETASPVTATASVKKTYTNRVVDRSFLKD